MMMALMMCSTLVSFGQERVNRQKLSFDTMSSIMTTATGWSYNSILGEWVDYDNVICSRKEYKEEYKSLQGDYMMSETTQNFRGIHTKTLKFNNVTYYVLVIEKWSGRYEYPSIKQDWYTFKETIGYLFTETEFIKLRTYLGNPHIEGEIELRTKITVKMGSKYEKYDETVFLDLIQTKLSTDTREINNLPEYIFPIIRTKERLIRFYLPEYYFSGNSKVYGKHSFEKSYFETNHENFNKILR